MPVIPMPIISPDVVSAIVEKKKQTDATLMVVILALAAAFVLFGPSIGLKRRRRG